MARTVAGNAQWWQAGTSQRQETKEEEEVTPRGVAEHGKGRECSMVAV